MMVADTRMYMDKRAFYAQLGPGDLRRRTHE
jgi:hypothetical protein